MKAKVWILNERPVEKPTLSDFLCIEEEIPVCQEGDVIAAAEFLSVDPYMRYMIAAIPLKSTIVGLQIAKVVESKNAAYPIGTFGLINSGWRTHTHLKKQSLESNELEGGGFLKLPDFGPLPRSLGIGTLGMPGLSAYVGLLEICKPKEGETVLVNGAAGAVGSVVCQIAKIKGCKVIGFAGSEEKVSWLKELGVDHVFNYKTTDVSEALKSVAPNGIDCFFDNVGGDFTCKALPHMAFRARISVCGAISNYNDANYFDKKAKSGPFSSSLIISKELCIRGFYISNWWHHRSEAISNLSKWIMEGKLKYKETVTKGFDKMPSAFIGLFDGENIGKSIVAINPTAKLA